MKLKIIDNDGFLALVDTNKYRSYVTENWGFEQLISHFIDQSNKGHMIIWRTGNEGDEWIVNIVGERTEKQSFREFESQIEVTDEKLFLTEYGDLTMAASYEDEKIPARHNSRLKIDLDNGYFDVLIRQLFNPGIDHSETEDHFEIVLKKTTDKRSNRIDKITWFNDQ